MDDRLGQKALLRQVFATHGLKWEPDVDKQEGVITIRDNKKGAASNENVGKAKGRYQNNYPAVGN